MNSPFVKSSRDILQKFRVTEFPDGTYVYRDIWEDDNGLFILMDDYQTTLRQHIERKSQFNELQWLQLMLGIVERLAPPHSANICHGHLCPSNGFVPKSKLISSFGEPPFRLRIRPKKSAYHRFWHRLYHQSAK